MKENFEDVTAQDLREKNILPADVTIPDSVLEEINKDLGNEVDKDVKDLNLIENVFDKRITDQDIERERASEGNQSNSRLLLDRNDVETKTELNDVEINNMSKILLIAERYNVPVLYDFAQNIMTLKISRGRRGRREFIQGLHADERREQPQEGMLSRLFGGGGQ